MNDESVKEVLGFTNKQLHTQDKGRKHDSKLMACLQTIPMLSLYVCGAFWISGPDADDYAAHPLVYLYSLGLASVLLSVSLMRSPLFPMITFFP